MRAFLVYSRQPKLQISVTEMTIMDHCWPRRFFLFSDCIDSPRLWKSHQGATSLMASKVAYSGLKTHLAILLDT
ncbi:hypothetical protein VTL71DRAFT_7097 [Oculimacula yallundae]|uniref:Uncharacterized protein n=1 Tax=Oculimacula yallundae TaxID=86028 RepID=A0ABR4BVR0_9HELO